MHSRIISYIICILMFTIFFSVDVSKEINVQVTEEWVVMDNNQDNSNELASNLTIDSNRNVYRTGPSSSGTSGLADAPWPMFRHDLKHTGISPFNTSTNLGIIKWEFMTKGSIGSSPSIDSDGTIYIGSYDHKLYAINPDGTEKWNFTTGNRVISSPAISLDGTIFIGSEDQKLYAINPDGTEKWNFITGGWIESSPAIGPDGTIYIGSYDHKLYAIKPDGSQKWNFTTGGKIGYSSPAISSDGVIYIGSHDNRLYAINPDGSQKWSFFTDDRVRTSPTIGSDGTIYIGSDDNKLYAINPNGNEKWSFMTGHVVFSSPTVGTDGTIYVGSRDHKLYAINQNGTEKWNFLTDFIIESSPTIDSIGIIYVGSGDKKFYAINQDGSEKWNFTTGSGILSSPSIDSYGTIYIGSYDYKLYAFGISNIPPIANASYDQTVYEGNKVTFNASFSYDLDGMIEFYEWDFDSSNGLWWETGALPDATGSTPTHTYGDDGPFITTLRVTDNDNLSATDTCNITVQNLDPTAAIESVSMEVEIGLRVTGRKYNNVSMTLYEDEDSLGSVSIERLPGSPNIQMAWIPVSIDFSKLYFANMTYAPEDPSNIGANPVWIYIKSENGTINTIHHTFNVQQSKKRNSKHWNHVEPWEVELNPYFIGLGFEITSHVTDPGSDDETLTYSYGSQVVTITNLNNPPNPDLYPSPEVNPRDFKDTTTLIYEGSGTIALVVKDDDNIRLGLGQSTDSFDI